MKKKIFSQVQLLTIHFYVCITKLLVRKPAQHQCIHSSKNINSANSYGLVEGIVCEELEE